MAATTETTKKGSLTIAGSGIASIKHMTLETVSHIKEVEKVYYIVSDPATEAYIKDNAVGTCFDLRVFYDTNKPRYESDVQMSEVMLRDVRAGHSVLGIFYGHPGVFVSPSHRAIAIAKEEGFQARMLPGISAEDYLFADIGFDPAVHGCMSYEATELLVRNKPLNTSTYNIIWQVGALGAEAMVFDNAKFSLLVDRLERDYGSDHKVVHYIGAILPQADSTIEAHTVSDLRKEDIVKQFNAISTLYIPPRVAGKFLDDMVEKLGIADPATFLKNHYTQPPYSGPEFATDPAYGPREKAVIDQIDNHAAPEGHTVLHATDALKKLNTDLALSPKFLKEYKENPMPILEAMDGLTDEEQAALMQNPLGATHELMWATPDEIANGRVLPVVNFCFLGGNRRGYRRGYQAVNYGGSYNTYIINNF
ncbi:tetrapyrrole methylase [Fomitiporia mediterranea MF3/22]|uniref:tetrapyrrole methylase n=1 Tax=Fomitiporia mediterranea (strain MF3/22) TaxID=694068 RepID=UPI0004408800|nr:tetrapyrrole methylase [Fomitiporia mediterranea MF3/22]EJC98133.1 tetrapyrrole methylase [Fomitiporia mediterranea MF3/22]